MRNSPFAGERAPRIRLLLARIRSKALSKEQSPYWRLFQNVSSSLGMENALRGAIHPLRSPVILAPATVARRGMPLVQARSASSDSYCSAPLVQGVPSLTCTCQFTRSACVGGQPRGVKPDQQCPLSQEKHVPATERAMHPNCTEAGGLVTQPAWLTHVNR